ncbi:MAG TPA: helix-turn-helix domain-containing protein [Ferruginibacter sp.]|nr:helix-turn-helix domain-containing protein [Ferruginibacter sp.]
MAVNLITQEDLQNFKTELFAELKTLFTGSSPAPQKKWLKSYEVQQMLGISPGTMQNMRINGTISFTKIGGLTFYDYDDILKLMEGKKKEARH